MMELTYAVKYLTTLAEGVDPATGEMLPEEHICNRGDTVRALYAVLEACKRKEKNLPPRAGEPWSDEEDQRLLSEFREKISVAQLAALHERTRGSIQSRLVRLGVADKRSDVK